MEELRPEWWRSRLAVLRDRSPSAMLLYELSLGVAEILPLDVEPPLDVLVRGGGTVGFEDEVSLGILLLGFGTGPGEFC